MNIISNSIKKKPLRGAYGKNCLTDVENNKNAKINILEKIEYNSDKILSTPPKNIYDYKNKIYEKNKKSFVNTNNYSELNIKSISNNKYNNKSNIEKNNISYITQEQKDFDLVKLNFK